MNSDDDEDRKSKLLMSLYLLGVGLLEIKDIGKEDKDD